MVRFSLSCSFYACVEWSVRVSDLEPEKYEEKEVERTACFSCSPSDDISAHEEEVGYFAYNSLFIRVKRTAFS